MKNKPERESHPSRKESSNLSSPKKENDLIEIKNPSQLNKKEAEEIEIKEEYETQVKIPKPILIEIFELCGIENFLKISLISKQFYFLLKSDNFWIKMLKLTDLTQSEIEEQRKTNNLVEIYKDAMMGWDIKASNQNNLKFNGKMLTHIKEQGTEAAVTKKKFMTGEENVYFMFEIDALPGLTACGIKKEGV